MIIDKEKIILRNSRDGLSLRKCASMANVLFFWGLAIYLLRSLFLFIGWIVIYVFFDTAFSTSGMVSGVVTTLIYFYLPVIALSVIILWGWAGYNLLRFGGRNDKRRVHPPALTIEEVSAYTGLSLNKLNEMRAAKMMVCHFDERKEVNFVECTPGAAPHPEKIVEVICEQVIRHRRPRYDRAFEIAIA